MLYGIDQTHEADAAFGLGRMNDRAILIPSGICHYATQVGIRLRIRVEWHPRHILVTNVLKADHE